MSVSTPQVLDIAATTRTDPRFDCAPFAGALAGLVAQVSLDPYADLERFLAACSRLTDRLPAALRLRLQAFARGEPDGALFLTGLPVEPDLPATPAAPSQSLRGRRGVSEILLATVAAAIGGEPVAYAQHARGAVFQDVIPLPAEEHLQTAHSSRARLVFHTEGAFHPHPPDYVLLYCERPDHARRAATIFAGCRRLVDLLDAPTRRILRQPLFRTIIDDSFGGHLLPPDAGLVTPVLLGDDDDSQLVYDEVMIGLTSQARAALERLDAAIASARQAEVLLAGTLAVLDNRRTGHGRTEFTPRYDGRDRWLRRIYAIRSLQRSAADRPGGGRVIFSSFVTPTERRNTRPDPGPS